MATTTQRKTKTQRSNEDKSDVIIEHPETRVVMPPRYSTVIWLIPIFVNLLMLQRAINHAKKRVMRTGTRLVDRVQTETERLSSLSSLKR
jgi:hypothetical protein